MYEIDPLPPGSGCWSSLGVSKIQWAGAEPAKSAVFESPSVKTFRPNLIAPGFYKFSWRYYDNNSGFLFDESIFKFDSAIPLYGFAGAEPDGMSYWGGISLIAMGPDDPPPPAGSGCYLMINGGINGDENYDQWIKVERYKA